MECQAAAVEAAAATAAGRYTAKVLSLLIYVDSLFVDLRSRFFALTFTQLYVLLSPSLSVNSA